MTLSEYDWESDTWTHANGHTNGVHAPDATVAVDEAMAVDDAAFSAYDASLDELYAWMPPTAPPAPVCPEAAFSVTVRGQMGGHDTMITVRAMSAAELHTNLTAIKGLLDAPQPPASPAPSQPPVPDGKPWCTVHDTALYVNTGKDGHTWLSHRTAEGTFCKGKVRQ